MLRPMVMTNTIDINAAWAEPTSASGGMYGSAVGGRVGVMGPWTELKHLINFQSEFNFKYFETSVRVYSQIVSSIYDNDQ